MNKEEVSSGDELFEQKKELGKVRLSVRGSGTDGAVKETPRFYPNAKCLVAGVLHNYTTVKK